MTTTTQEPEPMPYVLKIATEAARDLVVASLKGAADQRTRVARQAAGKVAEAKRANPSKDVRSASVRVTSLLGEADTLERLAAELAAAPHVPIVEAAPEAEDPLAALGAVPEALEELAADDGTSAEAQHLAELAGLTPADPDAVEDPITHALPEDEPAEAEEVLKP